MQPRKTPTSNHVFELPGGNEDNYLYVEAQLDELGNPLVVSVWEPTDEERAALAAGGTVELCVWGTGTPPVLITVGPSMSERKAVS